MVENVQSTNAVVRRAVQNAKMPEKGKLYTIKEGDCLWNLAAKELGKPKAKNKEINDYMLQIAKLNNLDSLEKMNNLKVSERIYLPDKTKNNTQVKQSPQVKSNNKTAPVGQNNPVKKSNPVKRVNSAEKSIEDRKNILLNDKTLYVEKMRKGYESNTNLYHVYHKYVDPKTGYTTSRHPVLSFVEDVKKGKIVEIMYNDNNDKIAIKYDYIMDANGRIRNNTFNPTSAGQISQTQANEMQKILMSLKDKAQHNWSY